MDIQIEIKKLLEAGMMYGGNTPEEKLTWLISELKNLSRVELPVKPANGGQFFEIEITKDREEWWYDGLVGKKFNARQATYDDMREASVSQYDAKDCYAVIDSEFNRYVVFKDDSRLSV